MKRSLLALAVLLAGVALLASLSCLLTSHFMSRQESVEGNIHFWIHQQLGITAEQEKLLEPIEARYRAQREENEEAIRAANRALAAAILEDQGQSARTDAAIEQIHHAMGELQKATLDHVFAMKAVLTPEQYKKLLRMTADGLNEVSED